jgi:hypothetical protein
MVTQCKKPTLALVSDEVLVLAMSGELVMDLLELSVVASAHANFADS